MRMWYETQQDARSLDDDERRVAAALWSDWAPVSVPIGEIVVAFA